jgi:hypothetical protein
MITLEGQCPGVSGHWQVTPSPKGEIRTGPIPVWAEFGVPLDSPVAWAAAQGLGEPPGKACALWVPTAWPEGASAGVPEKPQSLGQLQGVPKSRRCRVVTY